MHRAPMIPTPVWSDSDAAAFAEASGMGNPGLAQAFLCVTCVSLGITDPPASIAMVSGTSLCAEHM